MKTSNYFRVLYAEDNEDACFMLSTLFEFSNIEVLSAHSIAGAFQLAQAEHFDLYLLDTRFPEGSGLGLCRQLREFAPHTPIVFYSGDAYEIDKAKGLAVGADAYLTKPNTDALAATVLQLLGNAEKSIGANGYNFENRNVKLAY